MEISFTELKDKEIINVFDGKKLGRIIDILFDNTNGVVKGIVVPGEHKLFRKNEDIFVPLAKLKKIGDDVILVSLPASRSGEVMIQNSAYQNEYYQNRLGDQPKSVKYTVKSQSQSNNTSFVRYKRIDNKKYK